MERKPTGVGRNPTGMGRKPTGMGRKPTGMGRKPTGMERKPRMLSTGQTLVMIVGHGRVGKDPSTGINMTYCNVAVSYPSGLFTIGVPFGLPCPTIITRVCPVDSIFG
eukprot:5117867-Pyramimonas_sp.AAC.1